MDRWPRPLAHLLTGDVSEALERVLETVLTDRVGNGVGTITDWRPQHVSHRVGRSTTVQFAVSTETSTGRTATFAVVLAHGVKGPLPLRSGGHELVGWRLADDPRLPGLERALRADRVASLLELIGHPVGPPSLRRRAYRPGRRAVVEVTGPEGRLFLKVVRPARAAALADIHRRSGLTLPVPRVLGCTTDGIVVLSALPGRTLRSALTSVDPAEPHLVDRLPGYHEISAHLDRLPPLPRPELTPATRPSGPGDRATKVRRQADLISTVLPDLAPALDDLVDRTATMMGGASSHRRRDRAGDTEDERPLVPVHGDLYESQIMVTRGTRPSVCGVLDLDTVGAGHRIDDIATLCAHLSTLALRSASGDRPPTPLGDPATPVGRYLRTLFEAAEADHEPAGLRARTAARVVGMATGPFRVQETGWPASTKRRLDLARAWLDQP